MVFEYKQQTIAWGH